jgi:16S rRNA C967 or C1407 C5-methylase (RsmB/RsmF family)/NOL1/NOP2/fmu family ribosome biogenesis protein
MSLEFPPAFVQRVLKTPELGESFIEAIKDVSPVSVRYHPTKGRNVESISQQIVWCEQGRYLPDRPSYVRDPLFHAGTYYPQEAGSMTLAAVLPQLDLPDSMHALDLCAAPGGKTTLLGDFMKNEGLLVANEVIRSRANVLVENTAKWGMKHVAVTNNDPRDFINLPGFFDLVLVDAPCSGEGMFRKDPKSIEHWSSDNLTLCEGRQKRILEDVWPALKQDGYLIYSTCTFNPKENEDQVTWLLNHLDAEVVHIDPPSGALKDKLGFGYYCIPGKMKTEGFYCAVLRKKSADYTLSPRKQKQHTIPPNIHSYFDVNPAQLFMNGNSICLLSSALQKEVKFLTAQLNVLKTGTALGSCLPKVFAPNPESVLDASVSHHFPLMELDKKSALAYLHGDTFPLEAEKGFLVVTFQGIQLGFIKHLGTRFNNLYPKSWRIRMRL